MAKPFCSRDTPGDVGRMAVVSSAFGILLFHLANGLSALRPSIFNIEAFPIYFLESGD